MSFDLGHMWQSMSALPKIVVLIILFMSIYAIAVGVERLIVFNKAKKQSQILLRLISKLWQEGKIEESIKLCSDKRFSMALIDCLAKKCLPPLRKTFT